jgi:hypothetical protein
MRSSLTAVLLFACFVAPVAVSARQATAASTAAQATPLLVQSLAAQTGGVQITDVTLTGTSTAAGQSGPQSGNITLTATSSGGAQLVFAAPDGTHTDTRNFSAGSRAGQFSGPSGAGGNIPPQSLPGVHPAWFFPAFVLATGSSSSNVSASDMGQGTWNGAPVRHVAMWLQPASAALQLQASLQDLTEQDLYLDPTSLLPVAMTFHVRAFNPNNPNAPFRPVPTAPVEVLEEVRYSSYRQVQGVPIPFHIQILIRGALMDDIQINSATINTGVAIAAVN